MVPALVRRVPPRSDLAISCWKAHGWLVWAVHEDDGSRDVSARVSLGARKSTHFSLECRWRALAPSTIGPASRLVPMLLSPCSRTQIKCFPLSSHPHLLRLCCGDGTSRPRQICVLSLHRPTLHGEDERKAGPPSAGSSRSLHGDKQENLLL